MTKEQEEAIEMLEDIKNNTWTTKYIMSSDSKKAETVLNMLKEKDAIEKKDKRMIDLMAIAIDNYDSQLVINTFKDKEHVKQYFENKVEAEGE